MQSHGRPASSRATLLIILLVVLGALAAAGAVFLRTTGKESAVLPQSAPYTEGIVGTWQRVNPLFAGGNGADEDMVSLVFSGLVRLGSSGNVEPDLAELPEISEGGRTYTFHLREDLRWHDGERLTSADFVFTITAITDRGFRGDSALVAAWTGVVVEAPDPQTVVLRLPEPSSPFLARHATIPLLPAHLLRGLSGDSLRDAPFNSAPVGSGPYRLTKLSGDEARLVASDGYHLGRPSIGEIRIRFFTDYLAATRAMAAGEIKGLAFRSLPGAGELEALKDVAGITSEQLVRPAYLVLYLNNDAAVLQDARVRQAISLAVDRRALVSLAYGANARPSSLPVAPASWAYDGAHEANGANLERAAKLLDEAGWTVHPASGIRTRLGAEFRLTIRTDTDPGRVAAAGAIARQLEPLGIRATVASTSFAVLRRDVLQERQFDAALAVWDQGPDPDPYFAWHSSQMGTAGLNLANYSDPIADRLIEEGRRVADRTVRLDMYRQFQEIWERSSPSVIVAYETFTFVHSEDIEPVLPALMPAASSRFAFIHQWRRR